MNLFLKSIPERVRRAWRAHTIPNLILLETSKELGFSMPCIRKALLVINQVHLKKELAGLNNEEQMVPSRPTVSRVLHGHAKNDSEAQQVERAKQFMAKLLNLKVEELFPYDEAV
jgi:hypothetical protein